MFLARHEESSKGHGSWEGGDHRSTDPTTAGAEYGVVFRKLEIAGSGRALVRK